jgi:hypothetical protein
MPEHGVEWNEQISRIGAVKSWMITWLRLMVAAKENYDRKLRPSHAYKPVIPTAPLLSYPAPAEILPLLFISKKFLQTPNSPP